MQPFHEPCRAVLKEVGDNPESLRLSLMCETVTGQIHKVPSADYDFIKENFIHGPYVSGETQMTFGPNAFLDLNTNQIMIGDEERPVLVSDLDVNHDTTIAKRRTLSTTGNRSVLVVRVVAAVSTHNEIVYLYVEIFCCDSDLTNTLFSYQTFHRMLQLLNLNGN